MENISLVKTKATEQAAEDAEGRNLIPWEASCLIARGIVHELNNVLMGMGGRAEMGLAELGNEHPVSRYIKGIGDGVDKAAELTAELRRCLVFGEVNREGVHTDMNALVQKAAGLIQRADKGLDIELTEAGSPAVSKCDRHLALSCILMVMLEAAESRPGRMLRITVSNPVVDEAGNSPDDGPVDVVFSGVAGLSCRGMAELMEMIGGSLRWSGRGKDAGLVLSFPPCRGWACGPELEAPAAGPARTVLLVDDEEMVLEVGAGLLQRLGHEVIKALDGRRALELFEAFRDKIDVVMLDLVMDGMDGIETIQRLRAIDPEVKVILLSGYKEALDPSVTEKAGCPVFQKPLGTWDLARCLKEVLG